jgi:hypothetical protein
MTHQHQKSRKGTFPGASPRLPRRRQRENRVKPTRCPTHTKNLTLSTVDILRFTRMVIVLNLMVLNSSTKQE